MQLKGRLSKWINQHNTSMLSIKISLQTLHHRWIKSESERVSQSVVSDSLQPHEPKPTRFLWPWNSPGKNTGVGIHSLLQGIVPTQGSNTGLPSWKPATNSTSLFFFFPVFLILRWLNLWMGNQWLRSADCSSALFLCSFFKFIFCLC